MDAARRRLLRDGAPVPLPQKSFDTLLVLVGSSGEVVDKDALLTSAWRGESVEENSLVKALSDIRKALGEGPQDRRSIVTVPGRGYRFAAPVSVADDRAQTRSVAVLPVCNLSADGEDEQLATRWKSTRTMR